MSVLEPRRNIDLPERPRADTPRAFGPYEIILGWLGSAVVALLSAPPIFLGLVGLVQVFLSLGVEGAMRIDDLPGWILFMLVSPLIGQLVAWVFVLPGIALSMLWHLVRGRIRRWECMALSCIAVTLVTWGVHSLRWRSPASGSDYAVLLVLLITTVATVAVSFGKPSGGSKSASFFGGKGKT